MEQVEQRVWQDYLARMELTVKRVKLAELELLVAKVIQVTRDQMVTLEKLVPMGHLAATEKRVTQVSLDGLVPMALWVTKDQRVKMEILEVQGNREKRDFRGFLAQMDKKAKREGEETLDQREDKVLMGQKERRENTGQREREAGPEKTD